MSTNTQRVLADFLPPRTLPVFGSVGNISVGDLTFFDARFQGNTSQMTMRPASDGSAGANAGDGRYQFAQLFSGVAGQRHDQYSYNKANLLVHVDCEIEIVIANSVGVATAATADVAPGTKVGVAVDSSNKPIVDKVQVDGLHSVTIADNQAIGTLARIIKNGDKTCRVHVKSTLVFSQIGI